MYVVGVPKWGSYGKTLVEMVPGYQQNPFTSPTDLGMQKVPVCSGKAVGEIVPSMDREGRREIALILINCPLCALPECFGEAQVAQW